MSWKNVDWGWQLAFDCALKSLAMEAFPVGCVILDNTGAIKAEGINLVYSKSNTSPAMPIWGNKLAHAEINAILQLQMKDDPTIREYTLYTTLEPCPLCIGAIVMGNIRTVKFAARDPWAGAEILNTEIRNIKSKGIKILGPENNLAVFQIALLTYYAEKYQRVNHEYHIGGYQDDYKNGYKIGHDPQFRKTLDKFIHETRNNHKPDTEAVYNYFNEYYSGSRGS